MNNFITILTSKILKKANILKNISLVVPIRHNKLKIKIPIIKGTGYPNIFITYDSLSIIYNGFCKNEKSCFIDIGANTGQSLLKIKSINKNIHYIGFEPNKICFEYLQNLVKINNFTDCHLENSALSDRKQQVLLGKNEATDSSASIIENLRPDYFKDSDLINCISYDELKLNDKISFVKIDVEGAELEVLIGMEDAIKRFKPVILCEILDSFSEEVLDFTQSRADKLCKLLNSYGYAIIQIFQDGKKIKSYKQVETIKIQQWTLESYNLNDYLFYHKSNHEIVDNTLKKMCV